MLAKNTADKADLPDPWMIKHIHISQLPTNMGLILTILFLYLTFMGNTIAKAEEVKNELWCVQKFSIGMEETKVPCKRLSDSSEVPHCFVSQCILDSGDVSIKQGCSKTMSYEQLRFNCEQQEHGHFAVLKRCVESNCNWSYSGDEELHEVPK